MKVLQASFLFIMLCIIGALSISCSTKSSDKTATLEDIRPTKNKKEHIAQPENDTLIPYLKRFNNDSVALAFDSIRIDESLHFLDRFSNGKTPNNSHFILSNLSGKTYLGEWKFKDTIARKNALFNWLDHFGPEEKQIGWYGRSKISSDHMLILINKFSIIEVRSSNKLDQKKWLNYQVYCNPKDSTLLIIEQVKGKLSSWTKPKTKTKTKIQ
ncbi:MAG: hypothetical protein ACKO4Y_03430 [Flavobacteriales bacterium]